MNITKVHEIPEIVARAAHAFTSWSLCGPGLRRELLLRAAVLVQDRSAALVECMLLETRTSRAWAEFNVRGSIGLLKECASLTTQITGETIPSDVPGCFMFTERKPAGVVLGIAPWNAPLLLGLRAVAMPLACGNTVILKASELCPRTHEMVCQLLCDAGFPGGVVNYVASLPEDAAKVVEALVSHEAVRRVNFTGSTKTGRIIGRLAGEHLKPALLELGGKAPLVVLSDADINQAVKAAAFGAFMNQGQICMSTELIIVDESIADAFTSAFASKIEMLIARPELNEQLFGAMISEAAADHAEQLVDDALSHGAILVTERRRNQAVLGPVVVDHVKTSMKIFEVESFGPVVAIVRVRSAEEAIATANCGEYGLAAAVFGTNIQRTMEVAKRINCGVCHINGPTVKSEPQMPFGGVKASGYGRFNGKSAIDEFTDLRSFTLQTHYQELPF